MDIPSISFCTIQLTSQSMAENGKVEMTVNGGANATQLMRYTASRGITDTTHLRGQGAREHMLSFPYMALASGFYSPLVNIIGRIRFGRFSSSFFCWCFTLFAARIDALCRLASVLLKIQRCAIRRTLANGAQNFQACRKGLWARHKLAQLKGRRSGCMWVFRFVDI